MPITNAEWSALLSSYSQYRRGLEDGPAKNRLRLLVNMIDLAGAFSNLPTDVADAIDDAIVGSYNAAVAGESLPTYPLRVVFSAFSGTVVVDRLAGVPNYHHASV